MRATTEHERLIAAGVDPARYRRMCKRDEHRLSVLFGLLTVVVVAAMIAAGLFLSVFFAFFIGMMATIAAPPLLLAEPCAEITAYDAAWRDSRSNEADPGIRVQPL